MMQLYWVRRGWSPFVLLALLLSACQPSSQGNPATELPTKAQITEAKPLYPQDIGKPDPLAERLCDALQALPQRRKAECCGTSASEGLTSECARILTATLRDGAVRIEASAVDRCIEETSKQLAGCDWVRPLQPAPPDACLGIIQGQLKAGAQCRSTLECRDGLICGGARTTVAGVCREPSAVGGACSRAVDTLVTYARQPTDDRRHPDCVGHCFQGQCAPFAAVGESCLSNQQCTAGAHCAAGRCENGPPPKIGEPCDKTVCEGAAACVDGKCAALKRSGEPCMSPFECQGSCVKDAGATLGTCGMQCSWVPPTAIQPARTPAP